jgi:hypothetical protein
MPDTPTVQQLYTQLLNTIGATDQVGAMREVARLHALDLATQDAASTSSAQALAAALADAAKSERRAIAFGDIVHRQVIVMRAALVEAYRSTPTKALGWIENELQGPGHMPTKADIAIGAQALFDKEIAEMEAHRAAHPASKAERAVKESLTAADDDMLKRGAQVLLNHMDRADARDDAANAVLIEIEPRPPLFIAGKPAAADAQRSGDAPVSVTLVGEPGDFAPPRIDVRYANPPADARDAPRMSQCAQCAEFYPQWPEPHNHCPACCRADSDRLDHINSEYLTLQPFNVRMLLGEPDTGWRLIETESGRVVAEVDADDVRACIDLASRPGSAMGAEGGDA